MWNMSEKVMNCELLSSQLVTFALASLSAKGGRSIIIAAHKSCILFFNHFLLGIL